MSKKVLKFLTGFPQNFSSSHTALTALPSEDNGVKEKMGHKA